MKRKLLLAMACCMVLGLAGCSSEDSTESEAQSGVQVEEIPATETTETAESTEKAETAQDTDKTENAEKPNLITEEQACEAVKKYCIEEYPDLAEMVESEDNMAYWDASTTDAGEICVLYRSYTGALIRYYVNPETGDTYVTEQVPGIIDEEQKTDETLNIKDYIE
ncbi:MAG: hypothetical protein IJS16_06145 [Butyrivibrio sp.]|nr:hypothetical protein [Butyrivibrio sp.]